MDTSKIDPLGLKARQRRMDEAIDEASDGAAPASEKAPAAAGQSSLSKGAVAAAAQAADAPAKPKRSTWAELKKLSDSAVDAFKSAWNEGEKKK